MKFPFLSLILVLSTVANAISLDDQFKTLKESSETFKEYKVIKINDLNSFWSSITDSINAKENQISILKEENAAINTDIKKLKTELDAKELSISSLEHATTHINFLGFDFDKAYYQIVNLMIIGGLVALSIMLFIAMNDKKSVAKSKIIAFEKLEDRFENHKKTALEKQMKLRRELQTERNKLEQIRSI